MNVEEAVAGFAVEVVVVLGSNVCQFVTVAVSGNGHSDNVAFILKAADCTVNRSKADRRQPLLGHGMQFWD